MSKKKLTHSKQIEHKILVLNTIRKPRMSDSEDLFPPQYNFISMKEMKYYGSLLEKYDSIMTILLSSGEESYREEFNIEELYRENVFIDWYIEETKSYEQSMIDYYNGLKECIDNPIQEAREKRDEYIMLFAEIAKYHINTKEIRERDFRDYFDLQYRIRVLKKYIAKMEEEIKSLPGSGEYFKEGEKRFYS